MARIDTDPCIVLTIGPDTQPAPMGPGTAWYLASGSDAHDLDAADSGGTDDTDWDEASLYDLARQECPLLPWDGGATITTRYTPDQVLRITIERAEVSDAL